MRNIAIIPARSGSKGLKDKNIKMLHGKPLIAYSILAAQKSNLFDEIMVSTDSEEYAKIAQEWGANVPFLRSEKLSSDTASTWDSVKEVLKRYKDAGREFDTVTLLQPTSPLRTYEDIIKAHEQMRIRSANAVVSVCEVDHSPLWSNTLPEDYSMENFLKKEVVERRRQSLPTFFRLNGAIYICKTSYLLSNDTFYKDKCYAVIMKKEHSIDIDDELDFKYAELLINSK
ncbi:acylneuraminate cytidylyltransferase family protein [Alkalihalobacillus oceani]|uniref:acylneuraminate cytidylyltransferase family protein n=1 Tax=Halalkalibacter oceani TaxID=1653776 RepID=UPI00203EB3E3|nr:acylneuraminate cytidylyltransferase family protein [Halalkalibacter oceani]MCM3760898.1 acylneuraminate cytidylyltransferase family protein [Halalkalibacter oceani]